LPWALLVDSIKVCFKKLELSTLGQPSMTASRQQSKTGEEADGTQRESRLTQPKQGAGHTREI